MVEKDLDTNIFSIFEQEFCRFLSPIEYEIITSWIEKGADEEMIKGALREAVLSGVKKFRYIDKIIYNWINSGFKSMSDVEANKNKKEEPIEIFDYDWIEEIESD